MAMVDFQFASAPSSPGDLTSVSFPFFHHYATAPSSPSHTSLIPFDWESTPGTPKDQQQQGHAIKTENGRKEDKNLPMDFAFEFIGQELVTADELFEAGKIRPLKLPPRLQQVTPSASPKSPISPISRFFRRAKEQKKDTDPFARAREGTVRRDRSLRGSVRGSRTTARSLSPLRAIFDFTSPNSTRTTNSTSGRSKKWRLKDLLLFRNGSEGRETGNGIKYKPLNSTEEDGGGTRRKKGTVAEEIKRRTHLLYQNGMFGFLGLNPTMHGLAMGFGPFTLRRP